MTRPPPRSDWTRGLRGFVTSLLVSSAIIGALHVLQSRLDAQVPLASANRLLVQGLPLPALFGNMNAGQSIAIDGNTVVIGVPGPGSLSTLAGKIYVFVRSETAWTLQETLTAPAGDNDPEDGFGTSVGISGNTIVVGAPGDGDDEGATDRGAAYAFLRSGTTWSLQAKLIPIGALAGDAVGTSVAISGENIVIGAPRADPLRSGAPQIDQGGAYAFSRSGSAWSLTGFLSPSTPGPGNLEGTSVSVDGNVVAVGAVGADGNGVTDRGTVTIWRWNPFWASEQVLTASNGATGDFFGGAVAIQGNRLVVGARRRDFGSVIDQGAAYVFARDVTWTEEAMLTVTDGGAGDLFGTAVGLFQSSIVVGGRFTSTNPTPSPGQAAIFKKAGSFWNHIETIRGDSSTDLFGAAVAMSADFVVFGAPGKFAGNIEGGGGAYFLSTEPLQWRLEAINTGNSITEGSVGLDGIHVVTGVLDGACCWVRVNDRVGQTWHSSVTAASVGGWAQIVTPWGLVQPPDYATATPYVNWLPVSSSDGRYIAFSSYLPTLVAGDTNGFEDVFVRDRVTGAVGRVSIGTNGEQGNGHSNEPSISNDGRFVTFTSYATNLVSGDTSMTDVFVRDRVAGTTTKVSVSSAGVPGSFGSFRARISGDGRYVVFASSADNLVAFDTNTLVDIFLRDRVTATTQKVSFGGAMTPTNGHSQSPVMSTDAAYIAFASDATDIVFPDTNGVSDIFRYRLSDGTVSRASVATSGTQANNASVSPAMSADGRYVAFSSLASNLSLADDNGRADIFVHDFITNTTTRVARPNFANAGASEATAPSLSADGQVLGYLLSPYFVIRSPRPTITSVQPATVGSAGGDVMTLLGSNFTTSLLPRFFKTPTPGSSTYVSPSIVSTTQLNVVAPARSAGAGSIDFGLVGLTGNELPYGVFLPRGLQYVNSPPQISAVIPVNGPTSGGTFVTITGDNFVAGATSVTFGGVAATVVTAVTTSYFSAVTPPGTAGAVTVAVTTPGGTAQRASGFTYVQTFPLTITKAGTGGGVVTSSVPGIECGSDCLEQYPTVSVVTLSAVPSSGSQFTGWSGGGCTGTGTCTVAMTAARAVTATFDSFLTLTISRTGPGTVTSAPAGINCGSTCSGEFASGSTVTLTAAPDSGASLSAWSGACTGTGACQVVMSSAKNVTATFGRPGPTITSVTPNVGTSRGGTRLSIVGTSFTSSVTLTIGGLAATNVVVDGVSNITARTPVLIEGSHDVRVVNSDGQSATVVGGFTVVAVADRDPDFDDDGRVGIFDSSILAGCLNQTPEPKTSCWNTDLDYDGVVSEQDLDLLKAAYDQTGFGTTTATLYPDPNDPAIVKTVNPDNDEALFFGSKDAIGLPTAVNEVWVKGDGGTPVQLGNDEEGRPSSATSESGATLNIEWLPTGEAVITFKSADGLISVQDSFTYEASTPQLQVAGTAAAFVPSGTDPTVLEGTLFVKCGDNLLGGACVKASVLSGDLLDLPSDTRVYFQEIAPGQFRYKVWLAPTKGPDKKNLCLATFDTAAALYKGCNFIKKVQSVKIGGVGAATVALNALCGLAGAATVNPVVAAECIVLVNTLLNYCAYIPNVGDPDEFEEYCESVAAEAERIRVTGTTVYATVSHPALGKQLVILNPATQPIAVVTLGSSSSRQLTDITTTPRQPIKRQPYLVHVNLACPAVNTFVVVSIKRGTTPIATQTFALTAQDVTKVPVELVMEVPAEEVYGTHTIKAAIITLVPPAGIVETEAITKQITISKDKFIGNFSASGTLNVPYWKPQPITDAVQIQLSAEAYLEPAESRSVRLTGTATQTTSEPDRPPSSWFYDVRIPLQVTGTHVEGSVPYSGLFHEILQGQTILATFSGTTDGSTLSGTYVIKYGSPISGTIQGDFTLLLSQ